MIHSVHTISRLAEARLHDLHAEAQTLATLRAARPSDSSRPNLTHALRRLLLAVLPALRRNQLKAVKPV